MMYTLRDEFILQMWLLVSKRTYTRVLVPYAMCICLSMWAISCFGRDILPMGDAFAETGLQALPFDDPAASWCNRV